MRGHLPTRDHGGMDPAPALYMIRISGHLGATVLSAFPAMAPHHHGTHTVLTRRQPGKSAVLSKSTFISIVGPRSDDDDRRTRRGKGASSVSEDSSRAAWLAEARSYLRRADPVLARLIDGRPDFDPRAWIRSASLVLAGGSVRDCR